MSSTANVLIHRSQFPDAVRRDLTESLRTRHVNHKFHYDSVKQTQKWLALHQAYSPSRTDDNCAATYDKSFEEVVRIISDTRVQLIGLGCGGGQKDARILKLLKGAGKRVGYMPSDVSVAMVLVAREAASEVVDPKECTGLVCDLASADDLAEVLDEQLEPDSARLISFFGMIPNFEPGMILPRLALIVRPNDYLLFSANLAPGQDYAEGVKRILPLYDNALTRDWLLTFLIDLGVEKGDGELRFGIEQDSVTKLQRVTARFHFARAARIALEGDVFEFESGANIRLFFSYRHTAERIRSLLKEFGINVLNQWITASEEEGVFLCRKLK